MKIMLFSVSYNSFAIFLLIALHFVHVHSLAGPISPVSNLPRNGNSWTNNKFFKSISAKSTEKKLKEGVQPGLDYALKKNIQILKSGIFGFAKEMLHLKDIYLNLRKNGELSLTYTEFRLLDQYKHDLMSGLRNSVYLVFSPQYFFMMNLIMPLVNYNNPWAWKSFPSTFQLDEDKHLCEQALVKRKFDAVVSCIEAFHKDSHDDKPIEIRYHREKELQQIKGLLQDIQQIDQTISSSTPKIDETQNHEQRYQSISNILQKVASSYILPMNQCKDIYLPMVPGLVRRQIVAGLGIDPSWNLPFFSSMNVGKIKGYFNNIRKYDLFITKKGLETLTSDEVKKVCEER